MYVKNFLPYIYSHSLKQSYRHYSSHMESRRLIETLVDDFKKVESIAEIHFKLAQSVRSLQSSAGYPLFLLSQLGEWNKEIIERIESHTKANELFAALSFTSRTAPLGRFLQELLDTPYALLHVKSKSMLLVLCNPLFPTVLEHLAALQESPEPVNPESGTFAALKQALHDQESDYALSLAMLNDLTATYKESDPVFDLANSLLQSALMVYKDLSYMEEISLSDEDSERESKTSNCVLF